MAESILPIAEISSYHSRWTIKARVTSKSLTRTFNGKGGPGKVFSIDLLDKLGGEIRASFFNQAVEKFENVLEVGKCFVFSRGSVKVANRQYNNCNHRYELTFDKEALVAGCGDDAEIKTHQFNFVDLMSLQKKTLPFKVDICGVVMAFKPAYKFTSQQGKELTKRELTMVDDTATSMDVTLWGDRANQPDSDFDNKPVIAMKGVLVKEWNNGRAGSLLQDGVMDLKPEGPEVTRIQSWWNTSGSSATISALSSERGAGGGGGKSSNLAELRAVVDNMPDKPETFTVVARLGVVQTSRQGQRQPLSYMACSASREGSSLLCNKRVDETGRCPVCGSVGKAVAKLNIRCRYADFSGSGWATTFHEAAQSLLGKSADEIQKLEADAGGEEGNSPIDDFLRQCYLSKPFQLTMRAKTDTYNGEARGQVTCVDARLVDQAENEKRMLGEIQQMLGTSELPSMPEIRQILGVPATAA